MHQILGGGKAPSVHTLCPFGAIESLYTLLFMGSFIQKIYSGTVGLLVLSIFIAVLFRRSFCGLLCPFGALQELFSFIGQKIFGRRLIVPVNIDVENALKITSVECINCNECVLACPKKGALEVKTLGYV